MAGALPFDPFVPQVCWHSPDCSGPDEAPVFRFEYAELLEQCRRAVAKREEAYPELVAAGKLAGEFAERDLAAWRALLAEWQWIVSGKGELPCPSTLIERRAAVELALERVEDELARNPRSEWNMYRRHLLLALAWHLEPEPDTSGLVRLSRQLRDEMARLVRKAPGQ